jgi:hypothetical protein
VAWKAFKGFKAKPGAKMSTMKRESQKLRGTPQGNLQTKELLPSEGNYSQKIKMLASLRSWRMNS